MSEWYCKVCDRLNLSSEDIAGHPAICHNCGASIKYDPEIESLKEEKAGLEDCIRESQRKINNFEDDIASLEDEIGFCESRRDNEKENIADYKKEIEKIEKKLNLLSETPKRTTDPHQAKLGVLV